MVHEVITMGIDDLREFLFPVSPHECSGRPFKVYLACPLTGLDSALNGECLGVRSIVKDEFDMLDVAFEVYDPGDNTPPGTEHSAEQVYCIDHQGTVDADLVVFCAIAPSSGMGVETQIAAEATVPRVVIHPAGAAPSRMMAGGPARTIEEIEYHDLEDLRSKLRRHLPRIAGEVAESAARRRPALEAAAAKNVGRFILRRRISLGIPLCDLAKQIDLASGWVLNLERNPTAAAGMTVIQFHRLADALDSIVSFDDERGVLALKARDNDESVGERDSLNNLVSFVDENSGDVDDATILELWSDHKESINEIGREALVGRERIDKPVSVQEWRRRYKEKHERLF